MIILGQPETWTLFKVRRFVGRSSELTNLNSAFKTWKSETQFLYTSVTLEKMTGGAVAPQVICSKYTSSRVARIFA